jgi:hypothetical protein
MVDQVLRCKPGATGQEGERASGREEQEKGRAEEKLEEGTVDADDMDGIVMA